MPQKGSSTQEERITTSIKITPSVWKQFKKHAIDKDTEISVLLEDMIKRELEQASKKRD